ncbi:MAG: murein hydrolase activator EnvC family protein [Candidatus Wenzhouxiangella sp. M2_3B_020]
MAAVAALWLTTVAPLAAQDAEEVRSRLERLRQDIGAISDRIEDQREARAREQAALADAEKALGRVELALRTTRDRLAEVRRRQDELDLEAAELEREIDRRRDELATQLRIAYRTGLRSRLKAVLNQEDPARISRVLALHGYLGRARTRTIRELGARLARLEGVRDEQRRLAAELADLADRQVAERNQLDDALLQRAEALAEIDASIRDQSQRLAEMRESAARLEQLLEELSSVLADIPPDAEIQPFAELRGHLPMPAPARIVAGFDDRRSGNVDWEGWLIEADVGDPVRAVAYGRVAYADWLRGYGMMVIIDHGDGFMTLYGQNRSLVAEVGDWVAPGEVVALAGDSGGGTRPGLYFQIRQGGRPVDPAGWVDR